LEGCANNYAQFISRLKRVKKLIRKSLALSEDLPPCRDMGTYLKYFRLTAPSGEGKHEIGTHVNLWCQTRATGLADTAMADDSLRKFIETTTRPDPVSDLILDQYTESIRRATAVVRSVQGLHAKISCGPKACLESTQQNGGQTGELCRIVRSRKVKYRYNHITLERLHEPRRIKSSLDVLDYCVEWVLENPSLAKLVKPHVVLEPSKARLITITPFAVSRIQGVVAHLISPCLRQRYQTRSGMTKSRHLWNLNHNLHPQDTVWGKAKGHPVCSTDMSNATDQHSRKFAKRIWREILWHLKTVEEAPLGLIALAAHLHTSERYVLPQDNEGHMLIDRMFKTTIGIFMGDFLTKPILTFNQDICLRQAQVDVYSIVGDDILAIGEEEKLHTYLGISSELGNGVSVLDTYISKRFMFYCEEAMIVPRTTMELPVVQIKRGESKIHYLDTPRLRLLIPTCTETLGFSGVQAGRFSLLGKESRWVHTTHKGQEALYSRAQLLQHIMLPMEKDTLCPFIPEEIGGDGSFYPNAEFVRQVIATKSRDPSETIFRMGDLFKSRLGLRLVRSEELNQVVTKYKQWLPTEELLRSYLPENLIVPLSDANRSLASLRVGGFLETPQRLFMKMVKAAYYRAILRGIDYKDLPELRLAEPTKALGVRGGEPTFVPITRFLEHWCNPGYSKSDQVGYLVKSHLIPQEDYLSLDWSFGRPRAEWKEALGAYFQYHSEAILDLEQQSLVDHLVNNLDLPRILRERLHLFVESDSIIKEEFTRNLPVEETITLISRDLRLGADLVRLGEARNRDYKVVVFRPCLYLVGRLYEDEELSSSHVIEDQGAMFFEDVTSFDEGLGDDWMFETPIVQTKTRYRNVWVVDRINARAT
jgi:hypothetical protein